MKDVAKRIEKLKKKIEEKKIEKLSAEREKKKIESFLAERKIKPEELEEVISEKKKMFLELKSQIEQKLKEAENVINRNPN